MNRDVLISQIMSNPPYQLPPISHGNGVYSLDIEYMGEKLCKIGVGLEEVLQAYFHFVTKINYQNSRPRESITVAPIRPGAEVRKKTVRSG